MSEIEGVSKDLTQMKRAQDSLSAVKAQCLCGAVKLSCSSLLALQRLQRGGSAALAESLPSSWGRGGKHSFPQLTELWKAECHIQLKSLAARDNCFLDSKKEISNNGLRSKLKTHSLLALMEYNTHGWKYWDREMGGRTDNRLLSCK